MTNNDFKLLEELTLNNDSSLAIKFLDNEPLGLNNLLVVDGLQALAFKQEKHARQWYRLFKWMQGYLPLDGMNVKPDSVPDFTYKGDVLLDKRVIITGIPPLDSLRIRDYLEELIKLLRINKELNTMR